MTTVEPERSSPTAASGSPGTDRVRAPRRRAPWAPWARSVRDALDRPLTTYYVLIGAASLLLTIGLIMVLSASSVLAFAETGDSYSLVRRQLMWAAVGLPVAFLASRLPHRLVRNLAYPAFSFSLVLLLLTSFLGVEVNGNTNWLAVGPLLIQPSEVAKFSLVLWAAHIYANKERRLASLHEVMVPVVPGMVLATGLVVLGRDLGTAMVFFAILLGMLWVVGAPARLFVLSLSLVSVVAGVLAATNAERLKRLSNFLDPFQDYYDAGWQPAHGLYAMSSGGWFGEGIGASQQKWGTLTAAHTDFIFAVLGEELGLVGTLLVIGLFLALAWAALGIARRTTDPFVRYATFGIVVWLIGQMVVNVGMVLALLPVIGIPLPLVSYGGSGLVPTLAALGLLVGFARREPEAAAALAARRRRASSGLMARR